MVLGPIHCNLKQQRKARITQLQNCGISLSLIRLPTWKEVCLYLTAKFFMTLQKDNLFSWISACSRQHSTHLEVGTSPLSLLYLSTVHLLANLNVKVLLHSCRVLNWQLPSITSLISNLTLHFPFHCLFLALFPLALTQVFGLNLISVSCKSGVHLV